MGKECERVYGIANIEWGDSFFMQHDVIFAELTAIFHHRTNDPGNVYAMGVLTLIGFPIGRHEI